MIVVHFAPLPNIRQERFLWARSPGDTRPESGPGPAVADGPGPSRSQDLPVGHQDMFLNFLIRASCSSSAFAFFFSDILINSSFVNVADTTR